ncbi:MAG: hypothetical protein V4574_13725 [Pseudomonadota bacterium]
MRLLAAILASLVALATPAFAQGVERVTAPAGGISVEMPGGWSITPPDPSVEKLRGLTYRSPEFRRSAQTGSAPFLTLVKYPANHPGINPTMKVNYLALSDSMLRLDPVELLTRLTDAMRRQSGGLEVLDAPALASFMGVGAHVRVAHTTRNRAGTPVETVSEMWITLLGDYAVILEAVYDADEPAQTIVEIDGVARTLRIDETGPPPRLFGPQQR